MKRWISIWVVALVLVSCANEMKRGSDKNLYTIAGTLEVRREDIGKDIQLMLGQHLLFSLEKNGTESGKWSLVDYDRYLLLLLSETPRIEPGFWGLLMRAHAAGRGEVVLRFTPDDETVASKTATFQISIRK